MTEKTDIEALRDKLELALKDLTERLTDCHRLNFCMDELSAFTAFSSTVIDQLEEERQKREVAEEELAALRGEQEPLAWTDVEELRDVEKHGCGYLFKIDPATPYTDPRRQIMVYRRQPKPVVVLPAYRCSPDMHTKQYFETIGFNLGLDASKAAIEAADIVVKDGE